MGDAEQSQRYRDPNEHFMNLPGGEYGEAGATRRRVASGAVMSGASQGARPHPAAVHPEWQDPRGLGEWAVDVAHRQWCGAAVGGRWRRPIAVAVQRAVPRQVRGTQLLPREVIDAGRAGDAPHLHRPPLSGGAQGPAGALHGRVEQRPGVVNRARAVALLVVHRRHDPAGSIGRSRRATTPPTTSAPISSTAATAVVAHPRDRVRLGRGAAAPAL